MRNLRINWAGFVIEYPVNELQKVCNRRDIETMRVLGMIDCVTANERRLPQTKSDILYIDAPIASAATWILHLLLILV